MKTQLKNTFFIGLLTSFLISCGGNDKYTLENGVGNILHNSADDWNQEATMKKLGEKVWEFCKDNPSATELNIVISDECKDSKGSVTNFETKIKIGQEEIKEFSSYKDALSFNKNCYEWGFKLLDWKPCGTSPF
jgi:hypothetical protein